ncbi:MAG: hypothetical protein U0R52_08225 [Solirubrobacterales bacterium]
MEASERHDDRPAKATVRPIGSRLVIEHLEVEDERAARVVRERVEAGHPGPETVRDAIEIGARVLEREDTGAEVDYVKAEFGRHAGEVAQRLVESIDSANEVLAEEIAKSFGPDRTGTVQHQIKEMLDRTAEHQREALARQFSATDGSNPLFDFKESVVRALGEAEERRQKESEESRREIARLSREIVELKERDEADRRVEEAEQAGTRKGFGFEDRVHEAIARIASARGDAASHTGAEQAEGGGRKGDTLVELRAAEGPSAGRVVFEAKDKGLSQNAAWKELNEAMSVRAAAFGVLVVAGEERVPAGCDVLTEYQGNKVLVAVDREQPEGMALEVAYRLAAARVLMARDGELEVDAAAVRDAAQEAVATLKQAQAIRSTLTGIKTSSDKARAGLDELVEALRGKLERIDSLVGEAAEAAEADEPENVAAEDAEAEDAEDAEAEDAEDVAAEDAEDAEAKDAEAKDAEAVEDA